MIKKCWLFILVALFLGITQANAITLKFNGFIADEADLLSPEVENDLNMTLWDLQKKSGADLVVVTLPSLNGKTVEETAIDIGRSYKLGAKGKNNGVVFLTAPNERRMRIELGTGLEDKIAMNTLESIRDEDILPYYKRENYEAGIRRGAYVLANTVAMAENIQIQAQGNCPPKASSYSRSRENCPWWFWPIAIILSIFSPRRRFNSGRFGGFGGGGGFGGCGCSGSW